MNKFSQVIALCILSFLPHVSQADTQTPRITVPLQAVEPLIVLRGNIDYPPDEMYVNGKLSGFNIELIKKVAASINLPVVFRSYPWKRTVVHFKAGKGDAITYFSKTAEREKYTLFLEGNILAQTDYHFVINKNRLDEFQFSNNFSTLAGLIIGIKRGYDYGEEFNQLSSIKKIEFNSNQQIESSLLANRIDLGILTKVEFEEKQTLNQFQNLAILSPPLSSSINYLAFSKARNTHHIAEQFADALQAYKQSPEFLELKEKYNK